MGKINFRNTTQTILTESSHSYGLFKITKLGIETTKQYLKSILIQHFRNLQLLAYFVKITLIRLITSKPVLQA